MNSNWSWNSSSSLNDEEAVGRGGHLYFAWSDYSDSDLDLCSCPSFAFAD
jgi:hypothetical protein